MTVLEVPKQDRTQSYLGSEFPKWEFGMVGRNIPSRLRGGEPPPRHLSRRIADPAKGCPKRTELMYGNTTVAHAERNVQYRQALPKRQHLQIIRIGKYELTERFVRSGGLE